MLDDTIAILWTYPQLYVDVGVISWAVPRAEFYAYLRRIVQAGLGKRVLFGSDQMAWPEALEIAKRPADPSFKSGKIPFR